MIPLAIVMWNGLSQTEPFWRAPVGANLIDACGSAPILDPICSAWQWVEGPFGRYVARHIAQFVRLAGMEVMAVGAWWHWPVVIGLGLAVILSGWLWGVIARR